MTDVSLQLELLARLALAAALGAAVGVEREIHEHPAGVRTHLLVAVGAALFTVLSVHGFAGALAAGEATNLDPTRIAAQIVTGIGFLGAGAIIHSGTFVRGLTTAASLWATAAIGLAAGAGEVVLALGTGAIVLLSLGPLNRLVGRLRPTERELRLRLGLAGLEPMGTVWARLAAAGAELVGIGSHTAGKGRYEVDLRVRVPNARAARQVLETLGEIPEIEVLEAGAAEE